MNSYTIYAGTKDELIEHFSKHGQIKDNGTAPQIERIAMGLKMGLIFTIEYTNGKNSSGGFSIQKHYIHVRTYNTPIPPQG